MIFFLPTKIYQNINNHISSDISIQDSKMYQITGIYK